MHPIVPQIVGILAVGDLLTMVSIIVAMIRYRKKRDDLLTEA